PRTRYAINAIAKRLMIPAAHETDKQIWCYKSWCTGKDSNLRTSLGGTDLQSVGFNHSPTCAKPPGDAAVALHPATSSRIRRPWQHTSTLVQQSYIFANQTFATQGNQ